GFIVPWPAAGLRPGSNSAQGRDGEASYELRSRRYITLRAAPSRVTSPSSEVGGTALSVLETPGQWTSSLVAQQPKTCTRESCERYPLPARSSRAGPGWLPIDGRMTAPTAAGLCAGPLSRTRKPGWAVWLRSSLV